MKCKKAPQRLVLYVQFVAPAGCFALVPVCAYAIAHIFC